MQTYTLFKPALRRSLRSVFFQRKFTFIFFLVFGLLTAWVMFSVELPLLMGWNPLWENKIDPYRMILHVHAVAGSIALLVAPIQFLLPLRDLRPRLHRLIGRVYALAIGIAAPLAFWIAYFYMSPGERGAACIQAVLWFATTLAAVLTAIRAQFAAHRAWIMRSYALTASFVLSRLLIDVLHLPVNQVWGGATGFIVFSTVFVWLCADLVRCWPQFSSFFRSKFGAQLRGN